MPRIRRTFSPEFKAKVVVDLLTGAVSQAEVARKHLRVAEPEATAPADSDVLLRDEHRAALAAVKRLPRQLHHRALAPNWYAACGWIQ